MPSTCKDCISPPGNIHTRELWSTWLFTLDHIKAVLWTLPSWVPLTWTTHVLLLLQWSFTNF